MAGAEPSTATLAAEARPGAWRERLLVAAILGVAAFGRLYRIDLTWYFLDQVRDVSTAVGIASGTSFPLVGPLIGWTSGRLGPLYFYLIAPPFALTENPLAGFVFVALVNVLAVFLCYRLARDYFGSAVALVAALLFAVFPLGVASARVLWNPALVPVFTLLFMRALFALVVDGRSRAVVGLFAWIAVLTQIHLSTAALAIVALAAVVLWRPRILVAHVLAGIGVAIVLYGPYLVHEAAHRFENVRAIAGGLGAASPGSTGERALWSLLENLAVLYRPAIDGFAVRDPWPRPFLAAFDALYRVEAVLFCAGVLLCLWSLVRDRAPGAGRRRRASGLLLFWLAIPVALFGMRRTALWWYYFDLLYPSQFILAAIALTWVAALPSTPRARRALAWAAAAVALAIALSQVGFQLGLQRRIDRQAELVFDVPKFSVAAAPSGLGVLPSLPYAYRVRLLQALVDGHGMPAVAFARRVHGPVLGRREENEHLLRQLRPRRGQDATARAERTEHYLVTRAAAGGDLDASRSVRVGPYSVVAYSPVVDYDAWRCARVSQQSADAPSATGWERRPMPIAGPIAIGRGHVFACEGTLARDRAPQNTLIAVLVIAESPIEITGRDAAGRSVTPMARSSWQSPSLYWAEEAVFPLSALPADETVFRFEVAATGALLEVDVYELPSPAPARQR